MKNGCQKIVTVARFMGECARCNNWRRDDMPFWKHSQNNKLLNKKQSGYPLIKEAFEKAGITAQMFEQSDGREPQSETSVRK